MDLGFAIYEIALLLILVTRCLGLDFAFLKHSLATISIVLLWREEPFCVMALFGLAHCL